MLVQVSSGQGPLECERAVFLFLETLKKEDSSCSVIETRHSKRTVAGCFKSVLVSTKEDASALSGSIQWICQSPFRPHHKRKNWYIDVSIIPELPPEATLDDSDILFERFHSGGNGGQNVNKVETGVRLIHQPSGLVATCTKERSQAQNRRKAKQKLAAMLALKAFETQQQQDKDAWIKHHQLERGNPVRVYKGEKFKRLR